MSPTRQSTRGQLPQAKRVLRRVAHLVVVKVGEDVASLGAPSLDALGPLAKRVIGVLRRVQALGPMKAEVDEVARDRYMRGPARRVADNECDVPAPQERERILAEPRGVAWLERVTPPSRRDHLEESLRSRFIELHARRQLHEHDRGLRAEPRERPVRALDAVPLDVETLDVRDEAVELYGVHEIVRDGPAPFLERLLFGLPVEGVVQLDGVEAARVVLEPLRGREILGIEASLPVFVLPARSPDAQFAHRLGE